MPSLEIRLRKHNDTNILKTYTNVKNKKKILKDLTCSKIQKENKKEKKIKLNRTKSPQQF